MREFLLKIIFDFVLKYKVVRQTHPYDKVTYYLEEK